MSDYAFRHPLLPERTDTLDVGTEKKRFKSVHTQTLTLDGVVVSITVDGLKLTFPDGTERVI